MAHRPNRKKVLLSVLLQLLAHLKELSAEEPCCTHADVHRAHLLDHDFERLLSVKFEGISRHALQLVVGKALPLNQQGEWRMPT